MKWLSHSMSACLCMISLAACRGEHDPEHDHDHDHAEHVVPAHKPRSFPEAVRRLRELHEQVASGQAEPERSKTLAIFLDIATWLPEIAADSDMPEAPWNQVDDLARSLLARVEVLGGKRVGSATEALSRGGEAIGRLEELAARADPRWFESMFGPSRDRLTERHTDTGNQP